jgi:hypothetical protein
LRRAATVFLCAVAGALMMFYPPLQRHHFLVTLFWSALAGFQGGRWLDGLFVPLITMVLFIPVHLHHGIHLKSILGLDLFVGPVFLVLGGLGGFLGSYLRRLIGSRVPG